MKNPSSKLLALVFAMLSLVWSPSSHATPTEFIVTYTPGGPTDRLTRTLAESMPPGRYQIVYHTGASGRIGVRNLLTKPSLMVATMSQIFVTNRLMFTDLEYDPDRDLEVMAVVAAMPNVLICNKGTNFKTVDDIRQSSRSLNFAASGLGGNDHIATVLLLKQWSNNNQIIHYSQGGTTSLVELMAGITDCMFANYPLVKSQITNNPRLNVIMSTEDLGLGVPTWQQIFKSPYPSQTQLTVIVNRALDPAVKNIIRADLASALSTPGFADQMRNIGFVPILKTDARSLRESVAVGQQMQEFILRNQLKLR